MALTKRYTVLHAPWGQTIGSHTERFLRWGASEIAVIKRFQRAGYARYVSSVCHYTEGHHATLREAIACAKGRRAKGLEWNS